MKRNLHEEYIQIPVSLAIFIATKPSLTEIPDLLRISLRHSLEKSGYKEEVRDAQEKTLRDIRRSLSAALGENFLEDVDAMIKATIKKLGDAL